MAHPGRGARDRQWVDLNICDGWIADMRDALRFGPFCADPGHPADVIYHAKASHPSRRPTCRDMDAYRYGSMAKSGTTRRFIGPPQPPR
jgi:hypothetical protein